MQNGIVGPEWSVSRALRFLVPDDAAAGMAVEDPLRRIIGVRLG